MLRDLLPILLTVGILTAVPSAAVHPQRIVDVFPGGPPSIRIADKAKGPITRAEWTTTSAIHLVGCVPDARVTSLTVRIQDCKGEQAMLTAANGTFSREMKTMIANLPDGTPFTITVDVRDGAGRSWNVPDAMFTIAR